MQIKKFEGFMRTFCAAPPTATVTFVFMRFYKHTYIYLHKCILKSVLLYIHIHRCICIPMCVCCKRLPCWRSVNGPKVHFAVIKFC